MSTWVFVLIAITTLALILWLIASMVYVLQEYERAVVFRLGRIKGKPVGPGLILLLPFGIDRIRKVTMQTVAMNIPPKDGITKDNHNIQIDAVIYSRVTDPVQAVVNVQNYLYATSQAAQTSLQTILRKYTLNTLLVEQERITAELRDMLAKATSDWGVALLGFEIKDIELPSGEQDNLAANASRDVEARIFLCYRRADTQWFARGVFGNLKAKYGPDRVFRDIDSIPVGVDYYTWIRRKIGECNVMIVLIGGAWTSVQNEAGQRRLDSPDDLVRVEIEEALNRQIPIIPVLMQGTRMPSKDELPSSIAGLQRFQSTEITDSRFDYDVGRLFQAIDNIVPSSDMANQ